MINFFRFGDHQLPVPSRATDGSAGYDLRATEYVALLPEQFTLVKTGFGVELGGECVGIGEVGLIRDRSSMALKGLTTFGGVIDSDYRGEIGVILYNAGNQIQHIEAGDRIAQLVILPCVMMPSHEIERASDTARGDGAFGSTGR